MADNPLFELDADGRWRLAHDSQQWVLQRAKKRRTPRRQKPPSSGLERAPSSIVDWRGVSFVGSEKRILRRVLREAGLVLTPEAQARLDALPEQFLDFIAAPESFGAQPVAEAA